MANRNSTPRVALYARVSTTDQSTESQLLDLRRYVSERDWNIFKSMWMRVSVGRRTADQH